MEVYIPSTAYLTVDGADSINEKVRAPWFFIDLAISGILGVLNIIALSVSAVFGIVAAFGAAAFLFAVMLVALLVDAVFLYRVYRGTTIQPSFAASLHKQSTQRAPRVYGRAAEGGPIEACTLEGPVSKDTRQFINTLSVSSTLMAR
ncbi:hypothetical protein SprV_0802512700 [Sparganum proliferum]